MLFSTYSTQVRTGTVPVIHTKPAYRVSAAEKLMIFSYSRIDPSSNILEINTDFEDDQSSRILAS